MHKNMHSHEEYLYGTCLVITGNNCKMKQINSKISNNNQKVLKNLLLNLLMVIINLVCNVHCSLYDKYRK